MKTKRNVLSTAFSLSMVFDMIPANNNEFAGLLVSIKEVPPEALPADLYSVVGHRDTARLLSGILGREVPVNREIYKVSPGDILYVAQYIGPGLLGGDTQLPKGAVMKFYKVTSAEGALGECQWEVTF